MSYTLPDLSYDYDALEPFLSAETLHAHHDAHHRAYVDALNASEAEINQVRHNGEYSRIRDICDSLAFNYSGHLLHSLYWQCMGPDGGGEPSGSLAEQIAADFEDFPTFRTQLVAAASDLQGSGWIVLAWQPHGGKLVILTAEKHQDVAQWGVAPVLVLDLWEHAYYLDHRNDRVGYVNGFLDVTDWEDVRERFEDA